MKVSIKQEDLAKGLVIVGKAVVTKTTTLPVLQNILLEASKEDGGETGCLKLAATNLEISLTYKVNCEVIRNGSITIPARLLIEFVSSLATQGKDKQVELELDTETLALHVKCGKSEANIKGIHSEDYPDVGMQYSKVTRLCSLQAANLKEGISQVAFAASTDETRPVLTAVYFDFKADKLTLAAADSFRLAVKTIQLQQGLEADKTLLLPAKAMSELARLLSDSNEADNQVDVYVTNTNSQTFFVYKDVVMMVTMIEGNYPNYNQIIPKESKTKVTVATDKLTHAVKTAQIFSKEVGGNIIRLSVMSAISGLLIEAKTEIDVNRTELDISLEGEDNQIAFNAKYMLDVLNVIDAKEVSLELVSGSNPGLIKPVGKDDYVHVIMPMHLAPR